MINDKVSFSPTEEQVNAAWIDVSIYLQNDMVHMPKDPQASFYLIHDPEKGSRGTMYEMKITSHEGTHVDAPRHFIRGGTTIDQMPLDTMLGLARIIEIKNPEVITPEELAEYSIQPGERLLFKTQNSYSNVYQTNSFPTDFVYFSEKAAAYLAARKVRVVGIDFITVGTNKNDENIFAVHEIMEYAGIWIIEGLDLSQVAAGAYDLICLPFKLKTGDAGLARAVVRPRK
jgi:arylformamidase